MTFGMYHMYVTDQKIKSNNEFEKFKNDQVLKELKEKNDQQLNELREKINELQKRRWIF